MCCATRMINFFFVLSIITSGQRAAGETIPQGLRGLSCDYTEVPGIGLEPGVCRRDPSDVIKVGDTWFVWYTKVERDALAEDVRFLYPSGYPGTIWYATSRDEGRSWEEHGRALGLGDPGGFDLFYTAVQPTPERDDGLFENNSTSDFPAIGVAVVDRPHGPFRRAGTNPILRPSSDGTSFDSYRVDDASLLVRNGKCWLYYKGRNAAHGRGGPGRTQMGLAIAAQPTGPYVKFEGGRPLL